MWRVRPRKRGGGEPSARCGLGTVASVRAPYRGGRALPRYCSSSLKALKGSNPDPGDPRDGHRRGSAKGSPHPTSRAASPSLDTSRPATGTAKWFNETKGYGFVQPDDGGKDVFVHISAVERAGMRSLNEGQKISYEMEADRRSGKESAANLKGGLRLPDPGLSTRPSVEAQLTAVGHPASWATSLLARAVRERHRAPPARDQNRGGGAELLTFRSGQAATAI